MSMQSTRRPSAYVAHRTRQPELWELLMGIWGIDAQLSRQWWTALASATWSDSRAWRQELLLTIRLGNPEAVAHTTCAPAKVVHVVEMLCHEQVLSRHVASQIEERLLALVDAQGGWK
jgi:hypothetical protein